MNMKKVLFLLKRREDYDAIQHSHVGLSTGLYNSAKFVNDMLVASGVDSKMIVVSDNNDIDREVTKHRPTHVIIEALWVVPTKFSILQKLHPDVTWIIRLHSEMPFMAGEGMAMDWLGDYMGFRNIIIACNSPRMLREVKVFSRSKTGTDSNIIYLPNYYPLEMVTKRFHAKNKEVIDIGCFGAIRPLKNHLVQAFAAIEFAESIGKKLRFHVNAGRIEMNGEPSINNLKGLFQHLAYKDHQLINHTWTPREDFIKLCSKMDIGLQCSFSETFNIVGCDFISRGVPLVGSTEIPWLEKEFAADPTNSGDIYDKLRESYLDHRFNVLSNQESLLRYINTTSNVWKKYFKELE